MYFNANAKNIDPTPKVYKSLDDLPKPYTYINTDKRYLFGLLLGMYHWDNARIGSHIISRRIGTTYDKSAERFLNFLHV